MAESPVLRRIRDVRSAGMEYLSGEVEAEVFAMICDGCGETVVAATPEALADELRQWALGSTDLCPRCTF